MSSSVVPTSTGRARAAWCTRSGSPGPLTPWHPRTVTGAWHVRAGITGLSASFCWWRGIHALIGNWPSPIAQMVSVRRCISTCQSAWSSAVHLNQLAVSPLLLELVPLLRGRPGAAPPPNHGSCGAVSAAISRHVRLAFQLVTGLWDRPWYKGLNGLGPMSVRSFFPPGGLLSRLGEGLPE